MSSFFKKFLCRSQSDKKKHKKVQVGKNEATAKIRKGFVPIYVRENEDEEAELIKYEVPIPYLSWPPLNEFIKQAQDDEFETYFDGPITLLCAPDMFEQLLDEACRKLSHASSS